MGREFCRGEKPERWRLVSAFDICKPIARWPVSVDSRGEKRAMSKWISVKNKLPDIMAPVLIITDYGKEDVCYLSWGDKPGEYHWYNYMRPQHSNGGVTHWMPLPEQLTL
jgi:hypothetical protein